MVDTYMWLIAAAILLLTTSAAEEDSIRHRGKLLVDQLDDVRNNLASVTRSLQALSDAIDKECNWGGAMSDGACSLLTIEQDRELLDRIHDRSSPGKRSVPELEPAVRRFLEDLMRKKEMVLRLKEVLSYADKKVHDERKKSCQLNLGFHCQTQEYSAIADMFNFLGSGRSPGKRRRRTTSKH